jgi:halimadienyl-diphosphate synthase
LAKSNNRKESVSRLLVSQLGQQGGLISPSVYDTAHLLRLAPVKEERAGVIAWLLAQQHDDGGWGPSAAPRTRALPTLAAALALHDQPDSTHGRAAAEEGFAYLRRQAPQQWSGSFADDAPVGVELLLPRLLDEAEAKGIELPVESYTPLRTQGGRKLRMIVAIKPSAGEAPSHSWEGWGDRCNREIFDGSGGVGHSPAATVAWLSMAARQDELSDACRGARRYLEAAATASECGSGIVPSVWPISRFEQIWGLHALSIAGLFDHPSRRDATRAQLSDLRRAMRPEGIGLSDHFMTDGDCTATTIATLIAAGEQVDCSPDNRFVNAYSFFTYPIEIHPSLTTTAHGVLALALAGDDVSVFAKYLEQKQTSDGRCVGDKWHSSWLYATAEIIIALAHANHAQALPSAVDALLRNQHEDGGWGFSERSTPAETAYVVWRSIVCVHGIFGLIIFGLHFRELQSGLRITMNRQNFKTIFYGSTKSFIVRTGSTRPLS